MLHAIAADVWTHDIDLRLAGGVTMPSRATLLRLGDGGLLIHSPLPIDDATAREIDALGPVRLLVAPSCFHWMFIADAKARYPAARVLGAPGVEKKLRGVPFEPLPAAGWLPGAENEVRLERVEGAPRIAEHAFFHAGSRSLVVTDLFFNIHSCASLFMRLYLRLGRAYGRAGQSFLWRLAVRNRAAAARSAAALLDWDFERVVMAHGEVLGERAHDHARQALAWMTGGAPPLPTAPSNR
jgi:hypothetical protein